jgi:Xaa-Pro dipeptidase
MTIGEGDGSMIESIRPYYPRFSTGEYSRRYEAVRKGMERERLDGLIIYGARGIGHSANIKYLSNYADYRNSYILFPLNGPLTQFVGLFCHELNARVISVIEDLRWSGNNIAVSAAARAKELGFAGRRIGTVGAARDFQSLPYEHFLIFQQGLPGAEFVNATGLLEEVRAVPSEEEIERIRLGASLTDKAFEALIEAARPGRNEHELAAEVKGKIEAMGGEFHVFLLGATPMKAPFMPYPWIYPSKRRLEKGDIILSEISVDPWESGYAGQLIRPIALGEPTKDYWELFEVARDVYRGVESLMKTGQRAGSLHEITKKIYEAGYTIQAPIIHGLNQCLTPPLVGIPQIADWNVGLDRTFIENQGIVIEPNPCTRDLRKGVFLGDLHRVTNKGAVSYQQFPLEFVVKKV